jgi:hypothetical protein
MEEIAPPAWLYEYNVRTQEHLRTKKSFRRSLLQQSFYNSPPSFGLDRSKSKVELTIIERDIYRPQKSNHANFVWPWVFLHRPIWYLWGQFLDYGISYIQLTLILAKYGFMVPHDTTYTSTLKMMLKDESMILYWQVLYSFVCSGWEERWTFYGSIFNLVHCIGSNFQSHFYYLDWNAKVNNTRTIQLPWTESLAKYKT